MSVCGCGHSTRMHGPACTNCGCPAFAPAADPVAAAEAALQRQVTEQQLIATARRALAWRRYEEALDAVRALRDNENGRTR